MRIDEIVSYVKSEEVCIGFDLDGTLLKQGEWKTEFKSLVNKLASKYFVFLATGRSILECENMVKGLKSDIPIICDDGQYIYDGVRKQYQNNAHIDISEVDYAFFDDNNIEVAVESEDYVYTESRMLKKLLKIYCGLEEKTILHGVPKERKCIYKIFYYEKKESSISALKTKFFVTEIAKRFGSLTGLNVNKYVAFANFMGDSCKKVKNTLYFGDGRNDVELIENVKVGVAVDNAIPELKSVSKYILNSDDEFRQLLSDLL